METATGRDWAPLFAMTPMEPGTEVAEGRMQSAEAGADKDMGRADAVIGRPIDRTFEIGH